MRQGPVAHLVDPGAPEVLSQNLADGGGFLNPRGGAGLSTWWLVLHQLILRETMSHSLLTYKDIFKDLIKNNKFETFAGSRREPPNGREHLKVA